MFTWKKFLLEKFPDSQNPYKRLIYRGFDCLFLNETSGVRTPDT